MRRWFWIVALAAGCYSPTPPTAAPCGPGGECPSGQACDPISNVCRAPGAADAPELVDADQDGPAPPGDGAVDAPIDARVVDAATDANVVDAPANPIGCADGEREAFASISQYPTIAGCAGQWAQAQSLRGARTGVECGDDVGPCPTPGDACAAGWHVCGSDGIVDELLAVTPAQCASAAIEGRFVAAVSHCFNYPACQYGPPLPCLDAGPCSEPVCCGPGCGFPGCADGVWPGATRHAAENMAGCAAFSSSPDLGLLCCRDS